MNRHRVTYFRIERTAPWAIDPFYSTKGHETILGSSKGYASVADAHAAIATLAPELDLATPDVWTIDPMHTKTVYRGKDDRGYRATAYVSTFYLAATDN